jgi:hypothetical protein
MRPPGGEAARGRHVFLGAAWANFTTNDIKS